MKTGVRTPWLYRPGNSVSVFALDTHGHPLIDVVQSWGASSMKRLAGLFDKYDALGTSLKLIHDYLGKARRLAASLPVCESQRGLLGLTEYLERETSGLCA